MSYKTDSFDDKVVDLLRSGGVGLLPSDTIYGLSGPALNQGVVERINNLKARDAGKSFIVLVPSLEILNMLSISVNQFKLVEKFWPGKLTVKFDAPQAPAWLLEADRTLAVRFPKDAKLIELMDQVGPIISTSANLSGGQPAQTVAEAESLFGDQLDFYVDIGRLAGEPSTIVKPIDGKLQIIRQGAVKIDGKEAK